MEIIDKTLATLRAVKAGFYDAIFPRTCVGCGDEGKVWCDACASKFIPSPMCAACPFCGLGTSAQTCEVCRTTHALDGLTSLFIYADPRVRKLITGWKYHGDRVYAEALTQLIQSQLSSTQFPEAFETITTVPLHTSRFRARGFNQAVIVSHVAACLLNVPSKDLLVRTRRTAPQASIAVEKRNVSDLAGAFVANGPVPAHILLCDDVFTTGATMNAAAHALKQAGAQFVWGLTIAKG